MLDCGVEVLAAALVATVVGAVLGAVMGLPGGTHGIAFSAASGQGFTDEGEAASAAAFIASR